MSKSVFFSSFLKKKTSAALRGEIGKEDNDKNQHGRRGFPRKLKKSLRDHFDVIKKNQTLLKNTPTHTHTKHFVPIV
jgi:hypothetical protein